MVAIIYDNDETNDSCVAGDFAVGRTNLFYHSLILLAIPASKWIDMIAEGMEYVVSIPALFIVGTDG